MRRSAGLGVDQGRKEDMPEPVQTDAVKIVVGEIQLESAAEILDPSLEVIPAQGGDRYGELFELSLRAHGFDPAKYEVMIRNVLAARVIAVGAGRLAGKLVAVVTIDGIGLLLGTKSFVPFRRV